MSEENVNAIFAQVRESSGRVNASFVEVARRLGLDRRTVRARVEAARGGRK